MKSYNEDRLPKLPDDDVVLEAVKEAPHRGTFGPTAQEIAGRLGLVSARRLGRGAVKHSWTGNMAPALRISPRLLSLTKRGLLWRSYDNHRHRWEYALTKKG